MFDTARARIRDRLQTRAKRVPVRFADFFFPFHPAIPVTVGSRGPRRAFARAFSGTVPCSIASRIGPRSRFLDGTGSPGFGGRLRASGPALLVPAAWTLALAAHLDFVEDRTVLIAHLVMDTVLAAFTATGWDEMSEGTLRIWRSVLLFGFAITLSGTRALLDSRSIDASETPDESAAIDRRLARTVVAWMIVPGLALAATGRRVDSNAGSRVYGFGAALSLLGGCLYARAPTGDRTARGKLLGLCLVGVGQTAGILNAVYRN